MLRDNPAARSGYSFRGNDLVSRTLLFSLPLNGVVFERSTPADLGPSASTREDQHEKQRKCHSNSLQVGDDDDFGSVALRGIDRGGASLPGRSERSKYIPDGDIPCFRRAAPEKSVPLSVRSLVATRIYSR